MLRPYFTLCVCCACFVLYILACFAVLCMLCSPPHNMLSLSLVCICWAGTGKKESCVCVSGFYIICFNAHILHVIQASCLQQCKRLEKKRARQASDSLSDTDKAAPAAGEPGYLSKLRRSISSLRSSRRYLPPCAQPTRKEMGAALCPNFAAFLPHGCPMFALVLVPYGARSMVKPGGTIWVKRVANRLAIRVEEVTCTQQVSCRKPCLFLLLEQWPCMRTQLDEPCWIRTGVSSPQLLSSLRRLWFTDH